MHIQVKGVSKSYRKNRVLNQINLELQEGNLYCLIGRNGAGKSTLFHILGGLIRPDEGQVLYNGTLFEGLSVEVKQKLGLLTEASGLVEDLTATQYLGLIGRFYRLNPLHREEQIEKLVGYFFPDRDAIRKKKIKGFSTGMKKKLALIAACLHSPECLVLDEPFSGLDPVASEMVIEFLNHYIAPHRTILFSSHNIDYVERMDPHIFLLDESIIKFQGTIAEFAKTAENKFYESLLVALQYQKTDKI
jgi:ABC-type multidrug transport system ATPase subunit